jgi:hypothetical protein
MITKSKKKLTSYILGFLSIIILSSAFTLPTKNNSDEDEYIKDDFLRYNDFTYDDSIKSVLLYNKRSVLSYPILPINGNEVLELSFDDFRKDYKVYYYQIIHCNANWTPSDLMKNEYVTGFIENEIIDYKLAFSTDIYYTHYKTTFPNNDFKLTISGNYIVMVYEENKPEKPIITKRFMIFENQVTVDMDVHRATNVNEQFYRQEVDFKITHEDYNMPNPFENLNVVLMKNYRWDNAIIGLKPKFINGSVLDYDYEDVNVFNGGNEYRDFDLKSIQYQTMNIKRITYNQEEKINHAHILNDESRAYKQYLSKPDINGNFLIKQNEAIDSDIDAEYVKVHFTLNYQNPLPGGNLYLFGKFSNWEFKEELKLEYDTLISYYHKEVLLKQGYYNYMYCFLGDKAKDKGDLSVIEGSHSETENDYIILVYHRQIQDRYDRLIAYRKVNSAIR